ncbi:HAD-IIIA family hydrolase [Streptomyces sp. NPDC028722]|uniref:D-glycero-alpha-D-manno-heptose-1,7-bisphosphate 7-phosphatase n=1 Tax=Streptomyces sp. NPDC028722 TaxID=3155016 RepID=UPI0033CDD673
MERLAAAHWGAFFDRDGTLNAHVLRGGRRGSARHPREWTALPGVAECFARLRAAGAVIGVITNQPDLSRGLLDLGTLHDLHRRLGPLETVRVCPHTAEQRCRCRKPSSALLREAAADLSVDLSDSYFVGDRPTDAQAGLNAGCTAVLLVPGGTVRRSLIPGLHYAAGLPQAATAVLRHRSAAAGRRPGPCLPDPSPP